MNATTSTPPRKKTVVGAGELLWDLLPDGKQLGGATTNFAYHAHALGAEAWVVSQVGNDPLGREILARFHVLGLPADLVTIDPRAPTGTVSVELSADGQPRFTIHENVAWDNLPATKAGLDVVGRADAVCFGSLAQRSPGARAAIRALLAAAPPQALRVFDINLRQHFFSPEVITRSLELATVLKINDQELPVLAEMFRLRGDTFEQLKELALRFQLSLVALTRGARGSLLYSRAGFSDHPGAPVKVVDSVGAGDAFTAAVTLGLLAGWDLDTINRRANELAGYVCSQAGGTPPLPQHLKQLFSLIAH
jgi:fructokinase